jgi:hypothetical protein
LKYTLNLALTNTPAKGVPAVWRDSRTTRTARSLPVSNTVGWYKWQTQTTTVSGTAGVHDINFVFKGDATGQIFHFDYWKLNKKNAEEAKP